MGERARNRKALALLFHFGLNFKYGHTLAAFRVWRFFMAVTRTRFIEGYCGSGRNEITPESIIR